MRTVVVALVSLCLLSSLEAGTTNDIHLGGVTLGMSSTALTKVARKHRRLLEGPGKRLIDQDAQVFVQDYVVGKDKQVETVSGCKRQIIMLLNNKVMVVELWFKSKGYRNTYVSALEKLGYEKKGEDKYVGKLLTGAYAGSEVEIKLGTLAQAGKRRKKIYTLQARCYKVISPKATLEIIKEAQAKSTPGRNNGAAGQKALER